MNTGHCRVMIAIGFLLMACTPRGVDIMLRAPVASTSDRDSLGPVDGVQLADGAYKAYDMQAADAVTAGDSDSGVVGDPSISFTSWSDYLETLALDPCPESVVLWVTTAAYELDGGSGISDSADAGPTLSFLEALWIAHNTGAATTVRFSPSVFPPEFPTPIVMDPDVALWPAILQNLCVDGRGARPVLQFVIPNICEAPGCSGIYWGASRLVGVTVLPPDDARWTMDFFSGTRVEGCRLGTDGSTSVAPNAIYPFRVSQSYLGPGNVVTGANAVEASLSTFWIIDNYFGFDPVTGVDLSLGEGVSVIGSGTISGNYFTSHSAAINVAGNPGCQLTLTHNRFGPAWDGQAQVHGYGVISSSLDGTSVLIVGPGNRMRSLRRAVVAQGHVRLTQNSIFNNDEPLVLDSVAPIPPTIIAANSTSASGSCHVAGTVELFSDLLSEGEQYLGSAGCDFTHLWSYTGPIPVGRNVTATLTTGDGDTSTFSVPRAVSE